MNAARHKSIALLGAPLECGAGRRGPVMGPAALRTAGIVETLAALGHRVRDLGDVRPEDVSALAGVPDHIHGLQQTAGWTRALARQSLAMARENAVPVYLGGDHSLSFGTVAGQARHARQTGRPLFVLWLDAHPDFNTFKTTKSGHLHGMPVAFFCGLPGFEQLLGRSFDASVDPANVLALGIRSIDVSEHELLLEHGVQIHDMRAIDEHGIGPLLKPFIDRARATGGLLHVSLDVDFIDPDIAPAVGTTVPGGATYREAHLVMEMLHDSDLVTSLDVVELNPFLDDRGRTAKLMVDMIASLFGRRVMDRPTRSY